MYIIADTPTEYTKVFKDMVISDPGIIWNQENSLQGRMAAEGIIKDDDPVWQ